MTADGSTPVLDAAAGDASRPDAGWDGGIDSAVPISDACAPMLESCNGLDDNCDGVIDDSLVRACSNACGSGTETCTLGGWGTCSAAPPQAEVCDDIDNDCDGMTDELLSIECTVTSACGEVITGSSACAGGAYGACDAVSPVETCNGVDDDCDGAIDDGAGCPCTLRHLDGTAYLFCADRLSWSAAQATCRALGYELITIDDGSENTFARQGLGMDLDDDWWIGLSDVASEGTWVWSFGTSSFDGWAPGEPNNTNSAHDCGAIENGSAGYEDYAMWADHTCTEGNPYICESR